MKPTHRMLAALPALVIGLGTISGAFAPAAQAAGNGTWTTPTTGASVSGTAVSLQFSTSDTAVTFTLPSGSGTVTQTATVSGGVASGTFDSTKVANGSGKMLVANECNVLNMCDSVSVSVTVSNAATTPAPTSTLGSFSPSSGDIAPGQSITLSGSGTAQLSTTIDYQTSSSAAVTLPYSFVVPSLAQGLHTLALTASQTINGQAVGSVSGNYEVIAPDTTPPVISKLVYPKTFSPVRDGYLDHFYAIFSVNEASTATLVVYKSGKVVSSGTLPVKNTSPIDLRAGDRLAPGTYQWQLIVTDTAGNVTKTPMRNVVADKRHLINHTATVTMNAASSFYKSFSGSCSSATRSGSAVLVKSLSKCSSSNSDPYFDIAEARFLPMIKNAIDYGAVTVKVSSRGTGLVTVLNLGTGQFDKAKKLNNGTTTLKLNDLFVGYPKPELIMDIVTLGGHSVTVSSISINYVYKTLSK